MNSKTVQDSKVTIAHVMQPQDANTAENVHGGVIMKLIDTAPAWWPPAMPAAMW